MPRPIHFDLTAENPDRAVKFYSDVFNWSFQKWEGPMDYWMIKTGENGEPGIDGGMSQRTEESGGNTNTIGVPSVDEYAEKVTQAGGKIVMPKSAIPGVGWFALCQDSEGNTFGIIEGDEVAA